MPKNSDRDGNTLGYSERMIKEKMGKVQFVLLQENMRPWSTLSPETLAKWNKTKNDISDWSISWKRQEAKKQAKKERRKIRFIEW